jgi:signal transduction histidine kinase
MTPLEVFLSRIKKREDRASSVNQLFNDLIKLVGVHPAVHENEFVVTPLSEDTGVKINGTDLIQVLLNLTVNAFQSSARPLCVDVGGEVLRKPLDLTAFEDGLNDRLLNVENMDYTVPLVKLWVRDNGPGIPPEVLPKIFHPYFITKGPRQGTALGLSIVHRLVKGASGALHVHSQPGDDTVVTIYLPEWDPHQLDNFSRISITEAVN